MDFKCSVCSKRPAFYQCDCKADFYICTVCMGDHLRKGKHNHRKLFIDIDDDEMQSLKSELLNRIKIIKSNKKKLTTIVSSLISTIEKHFERLNLDIDRYLNKYIYMLSKKNYIESEYDEIKKVIGSKLVINLEQGNIISGEIDNYFRSYRLEEYAKNQISCKIN